LRPVPLSAVLENWAMGKLWESSKPISALLLQTWGTCEEAYYEQRDARRKLA